MEEMDDKNSFLNFIRKDRANRIYLYSVIGISIILLSIFKIFYPYPNIIFDSYNYVRATVYSWNINAWPIGYSKFLRVFGFFSHSPTALVCFQYLFLEFSCLLFFFSWLFFFRPVRLVTSFIFVFLFANPLLLCCSNYILSDSLFIALSILWITQLLWIICRPRRYMIYIHALLLIIAFTVRYNALYYPLIGTLAFLFSRRSLRYKLSGIGLSFLLIGCFIFYTSGRVAAVTGQRQFSPFGGWKLVNDAVYAYAHVPADEKKEVPVPFKALDNMVRKYFIVTHDSADFATLDFTYGSYYMFYDESPLVKYMERLYGGGWPFLSTRKWMMVSPLYQDYGAYLIRQYPQYFWRYFLWPNLLKYLVPPSEAFGSDNSFSWMELYGGPEMRRWFGLHTITTTKPAIDLFINVLQPYPILFLLGHLIFIAGSLSFLFCGGLKWVGKPYSYCLLLIFLLWLADFCFSLAVAGIVLRYQIFMMIIELAFGSYFLSFVYNKLNIK